MLTAAVSIVADVTTTTLAWTGAALAAGLAVVSVAAYRRLRGTTLAAPAVWAVLSAMVIAVVESLIAWHSDGSAPGGASLWRYAAAVGTFCPMMAVLGAKRPQDRGWQWIVGALWVVLLVPALQMIAARSGNQLELYGIWRALLVALIAMGVLNYLPTRFGAPATAFALGQAALLAPYLWRPVLGRWTECGGVGLMLVAALGVAALSTNRTANGGERIADGLEPLATLNERWLRFRDAWGAFWALRVLQRVNQSAELSHWPVRLEWTRGFVYLEQEGAAHEQVQARAKDSALIANIEQTLDDLLRRFERR